MDIVFLVILIAALVAAPALIYTVVQERRRRSKMIAERIRQIRDGRGRAGGAAEAGAPRERALFPTLEKAIAGANFTEKLLDELARAGWRVKPSEYVGIALGAAGGVAILAMIVTKSPLGALVGAVVGYLIPRGVLGAAVGHRKAALESQICDMVQLVSSALKSGYSFLRALQIVAREMPVPMCEVARKVVDETQLGVPLEDALQRMAERVRSYDMDLVVNAVTIQSQVGGSLAEVLDAIGETIRERVQIQAEVSSLTAEGRLSGIVLMLLTPAMAVMLIVMNPEYISVLISDVMGVKMIVGTVLMQLVGLYWIKKMMKIDV